MTPRPHGKSATVGTAAAQTQKPRNPRRPHIGIMHVIRVVAAHDASSFGRSVRSWLKRVARWCWPLAAASCWACRVGRNLMLVWKKLQVSQIDSKAQPAMLPDDDRQ
jgi:hypothetical protein